MLQIHCFEMFVLTTIALVQAVPTPAVTVQALVARSTLVSTISFGIDSEPGTVLGTHQYQTLHLRRPTRKKKLELHHLPQIS